jgi:hypothetical protein
MRKNPLLVKAGCMVVIFRVYHLFRHTCAGTQKVADLIYEDGTLS